MLLIVSSTRVEAQAPGVTLTRLTPDLARRVLESYGMASLVQYGFNERPVCYERRRYASAAHDSMVIATVRRALAGSTPRPDLEFSLSPLQDSAGTKFVNLYTKLDPVSPGFGSVSLYRFTLSADGKRVARKQHLMSETIVSKKK